MEILAAIVGLSIVACFIIGTKKREQQKLNDNPTCYKVKRGYDWFIWEEDACGIWHEKRVDPWSSFDSKKLDTLKEISVEVLRKINAERVNRSNPYWATSANFISECKFRNPFRNRNCGGHCMICGGKHSFKSSNDIPLNDRLCPSCSRAITVAMQEYSDLPRDNQDAMFSKEILEMMVALDLEDEVISLGHAKEDYRRIEAMTQSLIRGNTWAEEERERKDNYERQENESNEQAISRGKNRILS